MITPINDFVLIERYTTSGTFKVEQKNKGKVLSIPPHIEEDWDIHVGDIISFIASIDINECTYVKADDIVSKGA